MLKSRPLNWSHLKSYGIIKWILLVILVVWKWNSCLISFVFCLMSFVLCLMSFVLCLMSFVLSLMTASYLSLEIVILIIIGHKQVSCECLRCRPGCPEEVVDHIPDRVAYSLSNVVFFHYNWFGEPTENGRRQTINDLVCMCSLFLFAYIISYYIIS